MIRIKLIILITLILYIRSNAQLTPTLSPTKSPTPKPTSVPTGNTQTNEIVILQTFYNSLNGPSWIYPTNTLNVAIWNFTCALSSTNPCNPCLWSGVLCTAVSGSTYIQKITLKGYGLSGFNCNLAFYLSIIINNNNIIRINTI